jgi:hypothetical protein
MEFQKMVHTVPGSFKCESRQMAKIAKRDIFIENGFESVDDAEPDFELLALKCDKTHRILLSGAL